MSVGGFYEAQARIRPTGAAVDGRVRKAGMMFRRYLRVTDRLLDVGCGVGSVSLYLKQVLNAREVHGVEISNQRVNEAREKGIYAEICDLNHESLPYPDESFSAVFCGEVIEHVLDPDRLLDEIARTLTPEGLCVLTTPNLASWFNRFALLVGWQPFNTSVSYRHEVGRPKQLVGEYGCRDHLRVFTWRGLRELLQIKQFELIGVVGYSLGDVLSPVADWHENRLRRILYRCVAPLDAFLTGHPSLSTGLLVAFRKKTEKGSLEPRTLHR